MNYALRLGRQSVDSRTRRDRCPASVGVGREHRTPGTPVPGPPCQQRRVGARRCRVVGRLTARGRTDRRSNAGLGRPYGEGLIHMGPGRLVPRVPPTGRPWVGGGGDRRASRNTRPVRCPVTGAYPLQPSNRVSRSKLAPGRRLRTILLAPAALRAWGGSATPERRLGRRLRQAVEGNRSAERASRTTTAGERQRGAHNDVRRWPNAAPP